MLFPLKSHRRDLGHSGDFFFGFTHSFHNENKPSNFTFSSFLPVPTSSSHALVYLDQTQLPKIVASNEFGKR